MLGTNLIWAKKLLKRCCLKLLFVVASLSPPTSPSSVHASSPASLSLAVLAQEVPWVLISKDQTLRGSAAFLLTAASCLCSALGEGEGTKGSLSSHSRGPRSLQQDNCLAEEGFALNLIAGLSAFCRALQPAERQK